MSTSSSGGSGSRLPLAIGGGCVGLVLVGMVCIGLAVVGLMVAALASGPAPPQERPGTSTPVARPATPVPASQPSTGATPASQPGSGSQPSAGPQSGPQPASGTPLGPRGQAWKLARVGGYTCDLNTNQCRSLGPGEVFQVSPQGTGGFLIQVFGRTIQVDASCRLADQSGYTLFPCPFNPRVDGFRGVLVTEQGMQPVNSPFRFSLIDADFDQDGTVNEPGYVSETTGSLAFEAYREDGSLKFAGYIVDTKNYSWLYVFIYRIE